MRKTIQFLFLVACLVSTGIILRRTAQIAPSAYELLSGASELKQIIVSETGARDISSARLFEPELFSERESTGSLPPSSDRVTVWLFGTSKCVGCSVVATEWARIMGTFGATVRLVVPREDVDYGGLTQAFKAARIPYAVLSPHRTDLYRVISGVNLMPMSIVATASRRAACVILGPPSAEVMEQCSSHLADVTLGTYLKTTSQVEPWGVQEAYSAYPRPPRTQ